MAKDLGHQFLLLSRKMRDGYQTFSNLIKSTWKLTGKAKDTMVGIIANLRPHITVNKGKSENRASTLKALEKHWGRAYYERFYQRDEVISSDKFFRQVGTIVWQYQSPCKIIVIWVVNNFTAHRVFTAYIRIFSDNYRHQITNNFEKQLVEKDNKNIAIITAPIFISICMHIGPTGFLNNDVLEMVYRTDKRIHEGLFIVF